MNLKMDEKMFVIMENMNKKMDARDEKMNGKMEILFYLFFILFNYVPQQAPRPNYRGTGHTRYTQSHGGNRTHDPRCSGQA